MAVKGLEKVAAQVRKAARDAVSLCWMEGLDREALGRLDLSLVAEVERKEGAVKVKLVDAGALLKAQVQAAAEAHTAEETAAAWEGFAQVFGPVKGGE